MQTQAQNRPDRRATGVMTVAGNLRVRALLGLLSFVSICASAQSGGRWTPVPPGGPDSSPDYSWEKSDTGCLRTTNSAYNAQLEAVSKLLFGAASTASAGCATGVYLENGYSMQIPQMAHHAGIDFRASGQRVYSPVSGKVAFQSLDAAKGQSTLTIRTDDDAYNVLLLHCASHEHRRSGLPVPALKEGTIVQKGDQVCIAGSIGANAPHLHFEVKRVGQDASRLKAMFGGVGACRKSPCTLADVRANTVDPTVLISSSTPSPGDGKPQIPATNFSGSKASVRDDQAQFTFPIKPQLIWEWCDGGGAGMPYGWNVKVANGGNRYEFGFSMFSTQGAGRCHRGNFEKLLASGQFGAWKVTGDGGSMVQGAQVRYVISDDGKLLHIVLNDGKSIGLLFSGKPKTVTFESVIDTRKTTANVPVTYVSDTTGGETVRSAIRKVDFRNFTYRPTVCAENLANEGLRNPVRVRNGQSSNAEYFYTVNSVLFGDLNGDSIEESIVSVSCGRQTSTWILPEIHIFSRTHGGVSELASISVAELEHDYAQHFPGGGLWHGAKVSLASGILRIAMAAEGPRCCPEYDATFQYKWNGNRFVLMGKPQRKKFAR